MKLTFFAALLIIYLQALQSYAQNNSGVFKERDIAPSNLQKRLDKIAKDTKKKSNIPSDAKYDPNDPEQQKTLQEMSDKMFEASINSIKQDLQQDTKDLNKKIDKASKDADKILSEIEKENSNLIIEPDIVPSLMFSNEELDNIDKAILSYKNGEIYSPESFDESLKNGLSEAEKLKIEQEKKEQEKSENSKKSYIYLASIMYSSKDDWTVWINNSKITSQNNSLQNEFYIKKISPDKAQILWTLSLSKWRILAGKNAESTAPNLNSKNLVEINLDLKPNQTFVMKLNTVVEGRDVKNKVSKIEEKIRKNQKKGVDN